MGEASPVTDEADRRRLCGGGHVGWWGSLLNGETEVAIAAPVLFGFIRLATSRQVFDKPLAVGKVLELVDGW